MFLFILLLPAASQAAPSKLERQYDRLHDAATAKFGKGVVGRDIVRYGMPLKKPIRFGHGFMVKTRPATKSELLTSMTRMRRWMAPPPVYAGPLQTTSSHPAVPMSGGGLDGIAQCESGGDPAAVSPNGQYTGLYQFDDQTWHSVGGTGRAGNAPASEQHQRAAILYQQRGSSPWPTCGR